MSIDAFSLVCRKTPDMKMIKKKNKESLSSVKAPENQSSNYLPQISKNGTNFASDKKKSKNMFANVSQ